MCCLVVHVQVGLIARDDPEGPEQVEAPGGAHRAEQDFLVMGKGPDEADNGHEDEDHHGPEGNEVG